MTVADLFSGCGGFSSGLEAASHEVVFAGELQSRARLVYNLNFSRSSTFVDLSDVVSAAALISRKQVEMIVGGPPCQDFSAAGLRTESDRADLTWHFAEIVRGCRPLWFVMENVPEAGNSRAWGIARTRLAGAGYGLTEAVLDASFYGVPQLRKRRFLIGRLDEQDDFLAGDLKSRSAIHPLTVFDYLGYEFGIEHYYRHPRHWGRRAIYSIHEPAATIRSTNRPIPPKYRSHPLDSAAISEARPLTALQRARLQTFPKDFIFQTDLPLYEIDTMVANAVPVSLAQYIGRIISDFEFDHKNRSAESRFDYWLRSSRGLSESASLKVVKSYGIASVVLKARKLQLSGRLMSSILCYPEFAALSKTAQIDIKKALALRLDFDSGQT